MFGKRQPRMGAVNSDKRIYRYRSLQSRQEVLLPPFIAAFRVAASLNLGNVQQIVWISLKILNGWKFPSFYD